MNYNFELEYSIIGILITSYKEAIKAFNEVQPEYFHNNTCKELYIKARECYLSKQEFTEYTAVEHLKSIGQDQETAFNNVLKCSENIITKHTLKADLKLLESLYRKRELETMLKASLDSTEDFETNTDKLLQGIYDLKRANKSNKKTMKDMLTVATEYYRFLNDTEEAERINTGFPLIDSVLKGMLPGQLIGLAGRPGTSKSAFSLNIALNVASQGKTVAIFNQEMEANELIERMLSNKANISMNNLIEKFGGNTDTEREALNNKAVSKLNELANLPIYIADTTTLTTLKIRNECQQLKDLKLIIIDYLTLMKPLRKEQNRNLEVGQITRELKILASELHCPIIILAQLNRAKEESEKPSLSDYRDSGSIEQDISKSIMLWFIDKDAQRIGVTINKNRRGGTGDIEMYFNGEYMRHQVIGIYKEPQKNNKRNWDSL